MPDKDQTSITIKACFLFLVLVLFLIIGFFCIIIKTEHSASMYKCSNTISYATSSNTNVTTPKALPTAMSKPEKKLPVTEITVASPTPKIKAQTKAKTAFNYDELKESDVQTDTEIEPVNLDIQHSPDYKKSYIIHSKCPVQACVEMSIDLKRKDDSKFKYHEIAKNPFFMFKLRSKHKSNRSFKYLNAVVKNKAKSSSCSVFGNNTVAVLGFTLSKNPIISTEKGPLIVQDNNVQIGQSNGFKIYRNQKLIKKIKSPNPNFKNYGKSALSFHLNSSGQLFYKKPNSSSCIGYSRNKRFSLSPSKNCNFIFEKDLNYNSKFDQSSKERAYKPANNDNNYHVTIYKNNCS